MKKAFGNTPKAFLFKNAELNDTIHFAHIIDNFAFENYLKMNKTNAVRLLDKAGIKYSLTEYEVDESDLSATHVAEQMGQDIGQVFKTLVLRGDKNGLFVCVIPGAEEVDLKKAAKASGNKSAEMIHVKELLPLTGYIRGGCSPIGMKKSYPTYLDEQCILYDEIYISAGIRGMQIKLAPNDLVKMTNCEICELTV